MPREICSTARYLAITINSPCGVTSGSGPYLAGVLDPVVYVYLKKEGAFFFLYRVQRDVCCLLMSIMNEWVCVSVFCVSVCGVVCVCACVCVCV